MRKLVLILSLLLLAGQPALPAEAAPAASPTIRVGVWSNQANIILSAEAAFSLADADSGQTLGSYKAGEKVAVAAAASGMTVNGRQVAAREIAVVLADKSAAGIEVNRRSYRGAVTVRRTAGKTGLTVVNTVPLEEYLYGVVARVIPPGWPHEALKAQAVAARTFALYNRGKHAGDGFDVCATADCQAYFGKSGEDARATRAVDDTRGLVVTYGGKPIPAYYHASGGGYTENSENVFGRPFPFLRGVVDYDEGSPNYKWVKELTQKEIEEALLAAGVRIGSLQAIELSPLDKPPISAPDRSASGRVKNLRLIGSTGSQRIDGAKFSTIFGLSSTMFDISVILPAANKLEFAITDIYGDHDVKTVPVNVKPLPNKGFTIDKPGVHRVIGRANEKIVITGHGVGHGVGLSQWGAKVMAEKASPGDTEYFRKILKHYYTGVEIRAFY